MEQLLFDFFLIKRAFQYLQFCDFQRYNYHDKLFRLKDIIFLEIQTILVYCFKLTYINEMMETRRIEAKEKKAKEKCVFQKKKFTS